MAQTYRKQYRKAQNHRNFSSIANSAYLIRAVHYAVSIPGQSEIMGNCRADNHAEYRYG